MRLITSSSSQAWTYHPMLNISVIPQRKYNLAPAVINKLYSQRDAKVRPTGQERDYYLFDVKVASVTSMADKALTSLIVLTVLVMLARQDLSMFYL